MVRDDRGMVTVEAAFAIAAIVAVVMLGVGVVSAAATHVRCVDAAREVARLAAADDPRALDVGRSVAPGGAGVGVTVDDDRATARVTARSSLLPGVDLGATAVAAREPGGSG
ncbi:TadE family type IV pilus minor pilin [uncultured Williamsia sp.]|uniref:TadE family type IV pilus minor pilin n=1 Tax=uncultured Williamsia sp. TaxID=259311 RepID=UPI00261A18DA|nr:TadE family type IV pilus minor pilin [uncultured Williamsia sp.]